MQIDTQIYIHIPASENLPAFSLPPSLELTLLPSESTELLKLQPENPFLAGKLILEMNIPKYNYDLITSHSCNKNHFILEDVK